MANGTWGDGNWGSNTWGGSDQDYPITGVAAAGVVGVLIGGQALTGVSAAGAVGSLSLS